MRPLLIPIVILGATLTLHAAQPTPTPHPKAAPDSFQKKYGSGTSYLDGSPKDEDPINPEQLVTVGYLQNIFRRLETEIRELRATVKSQHEEILDLQLQQKN